LGELLAQGRNNLHAPWLGISGFLVLAVMLSLLIFIFEAVRDAFDPRKTFAALAMDAAAKEQTRAPATEAAPAIEVETDPAGPRPEPEPRKAKARV